MELKILTKNIGLGAAVIKETSMNQFKKPELTVIIPGSFYKFEDDKEVFPQQLHLREFEVENLYKLLKEYYDA
jgi:hypothetical protein